MYGQYLFSEYKYGEDGTPTGQEIDGLTPNLMKYLPWYYQNSRVMKEIQDSISKEFGALTYFVKDLEKQFFIDTATWGLSIYERELGLKTNLSLTYEERREIIQAKLRGRGTTTKVMIKNTAEAFSGGEVDVKEYPEEYRFVIQFIGIKGIPRNMEGFIDMLETIKPAHLAYSFKYTYTVWNFISGIWDDFSAKTWNELKVYEGE
uniref:Tail protein n=1 Tax=Siphoviridae sp. ctOb14 TaxID=2827862 RepID=A0A8S5SLN7_9CAUD|nr:MAG TPA: tail protein [Siphoviridae sp. ctOb14]